LCEKSEKAATSDKIVSLFEPHTDIIIKDQRDTQFGHKRKHGILLNVVIEEGYPVDSGRLLPTINLIKEYFDKLLRTQAMPAKKISGASKRRGSSTLLGCRRSVASPLKKCR